MTTRRGTTNGNARGSSEDRRRRREYLVQAYRADVDVTVVVLHGGEVIVCNPSRTPVYRVGDIAEVRIEPACRCYRCGVLLSVDTVSVDRIIPGCKGGTYRRSNIRPACDQCQSETGGTLGAAQLAAKRAKRKRVAA